MKQDYRLIHASRLSIGLLFLLFALLFVHGCAQVPNDAADTSTLKRADTLVVGTTANAPPFAQKRAGKIEGIEADFAHQLGQYLGKKVSFVDMQWERLIPALEEGKIDIIMSGMTITQKRIYRVAFTKPYFRSGQILLVRSDEARSYSSGIYDVMGGNPRVGVVKNTTGDFFISETINKPRLTRFSSPERGVAALVKKDIDVFVHDAPIICHYAAMDEGQRLTPILQMATEEYLAWGISKSNQELLSRVNSFLDEAEANGITASTIKRWIPYL